MEPQEEKKRRTDQQRPCCQARERPGQSSQPQKARHPHPKRAEKAGENGQKKKRTGGAAQKPPKRLAQARAFSLCRVMESRCRRNIAQVLSVCSSPEAKAEVLASADQTPLATEPQLPPTASMTIGIK
jgi:hypothetical protein